MHYKLSLILAVVISQPIYAEEVERHTMTSCAYQAGTAREIQTIRQEEGDDWSQFEAKIKTIYKEGQGRHDLLIIAKSVYEQPRYTSTDVVYSTMFEHCSERTKAANNSQQAN